jgi:2-methylcitrate dehydratase
VQCRLCDVAPVRAAGFDHTTQGSYAVAAGVSRTLRLDRAHTANAIAISGAGLNGLRVSRTGRLSQWKALAGPHMASCATNMALLARGGITGPLEVFEGEKGFMDAIAGVFEIHWAGEDLERVRRTSIKKHDAEAHAQTAVEAALELRRRHRFEPADIEAIDVDVFEVAWNVAGGGEEGDRTTAIATREQATDSLPYVVAVALIDGRVLPEQYSEERIGRQDVQRLLARVRVRPNPALSDAFPNEMPCRVRISLGDGRVLTKEAREYTGFYTQPMTWEMVMRKFELLAEPYTTRDLRRAIGDAVANIEEIRVADLMRLLGNVRAPETLGAAHGETD